MKNKKIVVLVLAAVLVLGVASVGFAATEDLGPRFTEACLEFLDNLSPEQQEQVEEAREEFRTKMEVSREEFRMKRVALQEEFLGQLPDEVRAEIEARMEAREEWRNGKMHGNCNGCHEVEE